MCVCVQGEREKREEGDGGFKNMTYYTIGFFFFPHGWHLLR